MTAAGPILVTGGSGQVGGAFARLATARGFDICMPGRDALDLADPDTVEAFVATRNWRYVVNAAAYTAVDRAETDAARAFDINAVAPGIFARMTAQMGIPIIHISTDYVFDGTKADPYVETDAIAPLGVYGSSKAEGEAAVRSANPDHAILRTAWVLSAGGKNFLTTMLRLGAEREQLNVVCDQIGCPTGADDLAEVIMAVITQSAATGKTWHAVNRGSTSWHGLAEHIFACAALAGYRVPVIKPITTAEYPTPARRPANSRLSTDRIQADLGLVLRPWQDAVSAIMAEYMQHGEYSRPRLQDQIRPT
jgi:dTDP-4-dehydrorhamnose reductase